MSNCLSLCETLKRRERRLWAYVFDMKEDQIGGKPRIVTLKSAILRSSKALQDVAKTRYERVMGRTNWDQPIENNLSAKELFLDRMRSNRNYEAHKIVVTTTESLAQLVQRAADYLGVAYTEQVIDEISAFIQPSVTSTRVQPGKPKQRR